MGKNVNLEDWREWLKEWGDRFLLFARQQARSDADAEDILQEAFVRVWSNRERLPQIDAGIIFTQIRRCAIDFARQRARRHAREESYAAVHQPRFFQPRENGFNDALQVAMGNLSPEQQEVVVLKIWGDQTFEAIGQTLDISPNTAASRYRYGMEHLKKELARLDEQ